MNEPVTRREIFSWCAFDFANSSYTTVIITAVYSAYFASVMATRTFSGDFLWSLTLSFSYALVVVSSPVLGAIADARACHKRLLTAAYVTCIAFTALLTFAKPGDSLMAMALVALSNMAFSLSETLVSSFLPHLSTRENIGRISGYGWSFGYVGGLLSLGGCLGYLEWAKTGGSYPDAALRGTCLITASFFLVAGLPTVLWLRQRGEPQPVAGGTSLVVVGFHRVAHTWKEIRRFREMVLFMISFFLFSSGIATVIGFAAIYAQGELAFSQAELILLIAAVNITSAVGAFLFGFFQDRTSAKTTLVVTVFLWFITILWAYLVESKAGFWGVANLAGIAIGASQSASRALVGLFAPKDRQAEFYGFWSFFGKGASIAGIFSFGLLVQLTGSRRLAILSTAAFFLTGLIALLFVNEQKGIAAAEPPCRPDGVRVKYRERLP